MKESYTRALNKFKNSFYKNNNYRTDQTEVLCPFKTSLILAVSEVFPNYPRPTTTHFHFVRELWAFAKTLGLRNKRNISNVK